MQLKIHNHKAGGLQLISKPEKDSSLKQLELLATVTKKMSDLLKFQLSAEQIDSLTQEHKLVMAQVQKIPKAEMKKHKQLLLNIHKQVQFVQEELNSYHDAVKDKLITFGKKRKQINAYSSLT
jgi:phage host-nuclease inhibitor protein Gam